MSKKYEFKTIKVRPETYRRLKMYQAQLTLLSRGEESYSMDDVINGLLNLLDSAKIRITKEGIKGKVSLKTLD